MSRNLYVFGGKYRLHDHRVEIDHERRVFGLPVKERGMETMREFTVKEAIARQLVTELVPAEALHEEVKKRQLADKHHERK